MIRKFQPAVLRWARERAGLNEGTLARKVLGKNGQAERVQEWERTGEIHYAQAVKLAEKTRTPLGQLFLSSPPKEKLPIKDFRTVGSHEVIRPSVDLLEVIYQCQRQQDWYRQYLIENGSDPLSWIGKYTTKNKVSEVAKDIINTLAIGPQISNEATNWEDNQSRHVTALEEAGILVMRSSLVGSATNRKLRVSEFRGFALVDEYAPLIFVNTSDAKAAQIFSVVHEVAHLWVGESGVFNLENTYPSGAVVEKFCNQVAAEVLVPSDHLLGRWLDGAEPSLEIKRLARIYKVSTLVLARRAHDLGFLSDGEFKTYYLEQLQRYEVKKTEKGKVSFYTVLKSRNGNNFCNALIASTLGGRTPYLKAFGLLGVSNTNTFLKFAKSKFSHLAP